jgi:hypothetical protein
MLRDRMAAWRIAFPLILLLGPVFGFDEVLADSTRIYSLFPQVVVGSGWSCDIFVNNQDSRPASQVVVTLFGSPGGQAMNVDSNLGHASSFTFNLPVGGTQLIRLSSNGAAQIGYAVVSAPLGSSVRASLVFYFRNGSQVTNQLGVPQVFPTTSFSFPAEIDLSHGISTGLALCNSAAVGGGTPTEVVVSVIAEDGTLSDFEIISLAAGAHLAKFLHEVFPAITSFRGSVSVSAALPFGLVALRSEQSSLGSLTINSSPVLGPFLQSGWQYSELEPNDTLGSNQQINFPATINGNFTSAVDVDTFSFNAKQGDVLSAMTQTNGNGADPVLSLLKADGSELSSNDQNGLLGQNDAFVQAVIPQDGKYYLQARQSGRQPAGVYGYQINTRLFGQTAASGPLTSKLTPETAVRGNTVFLEITGSNLCGATALNFSPPAGVTVSEITSSAALVTARLTVDPTAAVGARLVSVLYGAVMSNALNLQVAATGSSPPQISNLTASAPYTYQNYRLIDISFNFFDNDADIVYHSGDLSHSARAVFTKPGGGSACGMQISSVLNMPGKKSGSFKLTMNANDWVASSSEITMELLDAAGNISNRLTFKPSLWKCGP